MRPATAPLRRGPPADDATLFAGAGLPRRTATASNNAAMLQLENMVNKLRAQLDAAKANESVLRKRISELETSVMVEKRRGMKKHDKVQLVRRKVPELEDKVDLYQSRYSAVLVQNKTLRKTLDELERERRRFDVHFERTAKECLRLRTDNEALRTHNTDLGNALHAHQVAHERANKDFEMEKELWLHKMRALQERFDDEHRLVAQFVIARADGRHTSRLVDNLRHESGGSTDGSAFGDDDAVGPDGKPFDAEAYFSTPLQQVRHERLRLAERVYARIQRMADKPDLEAALATFVDGEDVNNTLLRFNTELNAEIESLRGRVTHLEAELREHRSDHRGSDSSALAKRLMNMEDRLEESKIAQHKASQNYVKLAKLMANVKAGIFALSERVGGLPKEMVSLGITDDNTLSFLGHIEQRLVEAKRSLAEQAQAQAQAQSQSQHSLSGELNRSGSQPRLQRQRAASVSREVPPAVLHPQPLFRPSLLGAPMEDTGANGVAAAALPIIDESDSDDSADAPEILSREQIKERSARRVRKERPTTAGRRRR